MGLFKDSNGRLYTMNVFIIKLVIWLGWLSSLAVGQLELSEAITGFVNFPEVGISCIGNLAVFITSVSKGRLDLELGARDVLAIIRGPQLQNIPGLLGLTTCGKGKESEKGNESGKGKESGKESGKGNESGKGKESGKYKDVSVVMLSYNTPNSSMKQFMKYISSAYNVHSVLLKCLPLKSARLGPEIYNCNHTCNCVIFQNVEEITNLLAARMPAGTLESLSNSQYCLLPSADCLKNGCHRSEDGKNIMTEGSSEGTPKSGGDRSTELNSKGEFSPPAVCKILDFVEDDEVQKKHTCICIPVHDDKWTKLLIKSFRSKDSEERKVSVMASDAMENYTAQEAKDTCMARMRGDQELREGIIVEFGTTSLILPRLTEILINLLLVGWFRVDGFSASMVARKAVKKYIVGSKDSGFAANAFLTGALLKSKNTKSDDMKRTDNDALVCQLLTFRGPLLGLKALSFIAGGVNLICSLFWVVFVAYEGRAGRWYDINSIRPSIPRVAVIIAAIIIAMGMDCFHLYLSRAPRAAQGPPTEKVPTEPKRVFMVGAVIVLEIACIVSGSAVLGVSGKKPFGKWLYSAVQALVWVKWGIGSYLLGELHSESNSEYNWKSGILVYSSAFFLNTILAGVRCKWKYSPS